MQMKQVDKQGLKHQNLIIQQKSNSGGIIRKYSRGKFLGKGGFAKCYELLSHQNNRKYAVKVIEKASLTRSKARQKLSSQIRIHRSLKSEYIVGFNHYFEDENNVYIILQLCSNQTLNQLIKRRKRITQIQAKYYMHQIALGIKDIHQNKVIHRDLKLGNLFLSQKLEVKIGDFGLAAKLDYDSQKRKTMCGTPNYIAPQILQNQGGHSYEVDVWSLGVIAYAFVIGRPPFQTSDVRTTYQKIKNCNYSFPDQVLLSQTTKRFISKMLIKDPSRRATIQQILCDDFFTQTPFPKTLPISFAACPPNSGFLKQYREIEPLRCSTEVQNKGLSTGRCLLQRKQSMQQINTERGSQKQRDSLGRVLVRASSNDKVDHKYQVVKRACSTNALMLNKKQSMTSLARQKINMVQNPGHGQGPYVWVCYFQQNPKFGICYWLNSNATGMRFNDSTYIISNSNFTKVKYYGNYRQNQGGQVFELVRTPQNLNKKIKIITHYQKQLKNKKQSKESQITNEERINLQKLRYKQTQQTAMSRFVVKHYKTSKVNIFWFNNKDYQAIFKDSVQILVGRERYITYVNKYGERRYFNTRDLLEQSEDIKKRMKYIEDLIIKIRQSSQNAQRIAQSESNKQNQQQPQHMMRSSSVTRLQKPMSQPPSLLRSSSTTTRISSYRQIN